MWLEIFGAVTGLIFVILEVKQNKWFWPLGLISAIVYTFVFFDAKFYADASLQVYFVAISIYGWYYWAKGREEKELPIISLSKQMIAKAVAANLIIWGLIYWILTTYTDSPIPLGDSFTTSTAIVANWLLARKYIEQWFWWVVCNVACVGLYIYKGLDYTAALYFIFAAMSVYGYFEWRKALSKQKKS